MAVYNQSPSGMKKLAFLFVVVASAVSGMSSASSPVELLQAQEPQLYKLYAGNPGYRAALTEYASGQGFRKPVEQLATVVHELVHIDSAIHDGFFIQGVYYEPYLKVAAWPALTNAEVAQYMLPQERGNIFSLYMTNTPKNTLANVVDELNAHGHVAAFVCRNEPGSSDKQTRNLLGHLNVQEAYLRVLRTRYPEVYLALAKSKESKGAITTITLNARAALAACGVGPNSIPGVEADNFLRM